MKVALVHDFLIQNGGAEAVVKIFAEMFPEAPIFTLVSDERKMDPYFRNRQIIPSFIENMPFGKCKYQWFLPLMPLAIEQLNLMNYDLIISSSSAFAHGVITNPDAMHICYCHTPTRYLWTDTYDYVKELKHNIIIRKAIPFALSKIRMWNRLAAERPNFFLANSKCVQRRIERYYNRKSDIIYPPVETGKFFIADDVEIDKNKGYFLVGGRLVAYKRYDLVVTAFNKLGMRLKIFGDGPEEKKLKQMARGNIEFLGRASDEERGELYKKAIAFIHPQEEDFGITAVESMASGRPVIAFKKGGALETVVENETGVFFEEQNWPALADTIIKFKPEMFNPQLIRQHAEKFDVRVFKERIKNFIEHSERGEKYLSADLSK
ncbi:MAG: glycosyltransferase [bacterium]